VLEREVDPVDVSDGDRVVLVLPVPLSLGDIIRLTI